MCGDKFARGGCGNVAKSRIPSSDGWLRGKWDLVNDMTNAILDDESKIKWIVYFYFLASLCVIWI